jgi:RNA polymerase sigma factor (sigma-70 family)
MPEKVNQFEHLMQQVRQGDEQASERLCREYASHVIRVVRRRLHPRLRRRLDSGDVLQAVWASFFTIPTERFTFRSEKQLIEFLSRVAQNKVIDENRRCFGTDKRQLAREEYLEDLDYGEPLRDPNQPTPSKAVIADDRWEELLRDQPRLIRDLLALKRLGFTNVEIAGRLGVHAKTVQRHLRKLAEELPKS